MRARGPVGPRAAVEPNPMNIQAPRASGDRRGVAPRARSRSSDVELARQLARLSGGLAARQLGERLGARASSIGSRLSVASHGREPTGAPIEAIRAATRVQESEAAAAGAGSNSPAAHRVQPLQTSVVAAAACRVMGSVSLAERRQFAAVVAAQRRRPASADRAPPRGRSSIDRLAARASGTRRRASGVPPSASTPQRAGRRTRSRCRMIHGDRRRHGPEPGRRDVAPSRGTHVPLHAEPPL